MIIARLLTNVIPQINLYIGSSEMSVWQYRILITFYMVVLQCSQWLRRQNVWIYAMLVMTMNLGLMMSHDLIWLYYFFGLHGLLFIHAIDYQRVYTTTQISSYQERFTIVPCMRASLKHCDFDISRESIRMHYRKIINRTLNVILLGKIECFILIRILIGALLQPRIIIVILNL